jgi:drug/metabolite transporter (DMT)-like permease
MRTSTPIPTPTPDPFRGTWVDHLPSASKVALDGGLALVFGLCVIALLALLSRYARSFGLPWGPQHGLLGWAAVALVIGSVCAWLLYLKLAAAAAAIGVSVGLLALALAGIVLNDKPSRRRRR